MSSLQSPATPRKKASKRKLPGDTDRSPRHKKKRWTDDHRPLHPDVIKFQANEYDFSIFVRKGLEHKDPGNDKSIARLKVGTFKIAEDARGQRKDDEMQGDACMFPTPSSGTKQTSGKCEWRMCFQGGESSHNQVGVETVDLAPELRYDGSFTGTEEFKRATGQEATRRKLWYRFILRACFAVLPQELQKKGGSLENAVGSKTTAASASNPAAATESSENVEDEAANA